MANNLRSYLISLGFKVDDKTWKTFQDSVTKTAAEISELGAESIATATAIGYMVDKVAREYEQLAYVSQRTNVPVAKLKAFEFASRQVGVSSDEARAATEAFYATLRTSPGARGLLGAFGATEQGGPVALVEKLKKTFGESGYFIAQKFAESFGIDERTFRQYWTNLEALKKAQVDQERRQQEAGVGSKEATEKFLGFSRALNQLEEDFGNLGARIAQDFVGPATWVVKGLDDITQALSRLDKASGGELGTVAGLTTGLGSSALVGLLLKRIASKLFGRGAASAAAAAVGGGGAAATGTGAAAGVGLGGILTLGGLVAALGAAVYPQAAGESDAAERARRSGAGGAVSPNAKAIVDYFVGQGWTQNQAIGIAANLQQESGLRPNAENAGHYGVAQWDAERQRNFAKWAGHDIRQSTLAEQLAFVQYELTQGTEQRAGNAIKGATSRHGAVVGGMAYERPANPGTPAFDNEYYKRTAIADRMTSALANPANQNNPGNVTINHDTDINISGNVDKDVANDILSSQDGVYSDAVRNFLPRTR